MMHTTFPMLVHRPEDMCAAMQARRAEIGYMLADLEHRAGLQEGYASKMERPDRERHQPLRHVPAGALDHVLATALIAAVRSGDAAAAQEAADRLESHLAKCDPGGFRLTLMGSYVLEALGLSLVVMERGQAERLVAASKSGAVEIQRRPHGRHKALPATRRRTASVTFSVIQPARP